MTTKYNTARIQDSQSLLDSIKEHIPCQACGETDPIVKQFHHIDNKEDNISRLRTNPPKLIIELNKCVLVCANCHLKIHARSIILNQHTRLYIDWIREEKPRSGAEDVAIQDALHLIDSIGHITAKMIADHRKISASCSHRIIGRALAKNLIVQDGIITDSLGNISKRYTRSDR